MASVGSHPTRRRDINGLRAVAVLLVVVTHTLGVPTGGYLGVDVFFVLSGFLITGIMLKEYDRTGRVSFAEFYRRRARRILPAAVLVIAVTIATAQVLFLANRADQVAADGLWSLAFLANWHFALEGADYFDATGPVSPFQHYWSLGVEEQFYVVWPLLVVLCLLLARRFRGGRVPVVGIVVAAATVGSFWWALHQTAAVPTVAYFSTFTRAWELGIGALLAVVAERLARVQGRAWRVALAWCGLAALGIGAFRLTEHSPVPGPWAAVPVLGTVAVVAAGTGVQQPPRLAGILSNPVAQYIGLISFSLYLWHWPVVVYLQSVMAPGVARSLTAVVVAIALSVLSFHLVEDPVRRSSWLEPKSRKRLAPRSEPLVGRRAAVACLASLVLLAGITSGYAVLRSPSAPAVAALEVDGVADPVTDVDPASPEGKLSAGVRAALQSSTWPALQPSLDSLGEGALVAPWSKDKCLDVRTDDDVARCSYGDDAGTQLAVVVGDSVATSYVPGISDALGPQGWRVQPLTLQACPAAQVQVNDFQGALWTPCVPHRDWVLEKVAALKPALVVVASAEDSIDRLVSGAKDQAAYDEWRDGMTQTLTRLRALAPQVVVLGAPPAGQDPRTCATARSTPADCLSKMHKRWWSIRAAEQAAVEAAGSAEEGVRYVDVHTWFCSENGYCPAFIGSTPVRADPNHLTDAFSHQLAGVLAGALLPTPAAPAADEQAAGT